MKTTYIIAIAVIVIVVIIGSVFAYTYIQSQSTANNSPTPPPTATPTAAPTATPTATPTTTPTSTPTATPTSTPTATPTPTYSAPTPTPTPIPTPTPAPTQLAAADILGAGGTLVNPLMQTWVTAYEIVQPNLQITYNPVGSGTGITDFQEQITNFGESDVPLQPTPDISGLPAGTTALTIPISASAVVPAYNILLNNGTYCQNGLNFTGNVLAEIFYGTITNWSDLRIANLQSASTAAQLPNAAITVVHRGDSSGTMYAFTDFLSKSNSTWATNIGTSKKPAWPVGLGYNLNSGVAAGIAQNPDSIGPLEIAYELQDAGAISYGTVQNAAGNYILGSVATAQAALAAGAGVLPPGNNVTAWSTVSIIDNIFSNTTATTGYPITTLTYALMYENQNYASATAAQADATVNFLYWIVNSGQAFGPTAGYVPLPANIIAIDDTTLGEITYNGSPITIIA